MFAPLALLAGVAAPPTVLKQGMVIDGSLKVARRVYRFATSEGSARAGDETIPTLTPALTIRGNNITVDFAGATLQGTAETAEPDQRHGLAVRVEGNNVTLKNLNVHGYKVGLIARNAKNLRVLDSDFSYNWKQHLASTLEKEDLSDWMSYHHNEHDEWLRYGAAIYLSGCQGFEVRGVKAVGGQCGLMLNRSDRGKVWNNNFSFLTGVGLGLYRSSDNQIMHNRIDWCVRGFSYGVYNRGQDSAGILIFEQCNRNLFAYNSVTHGGDGFFLWAGQETMDTGKGGCNDNVLYGNDFSHAPTNGIEATFSRNFFVYNKVHECFHGVWGGYSYDTLVLANDFAQNQRGIAVEHGQANEYRGNQFHGEDVAIALWANASQDPNWGYGKVRDTRNRDSKIVGNSFYNNPLAIDLRRTTNLEVNANSFIGVGKVLRLGEPPVTFAQAPFFNAYYNGTPVPAELKSASDRIQAGSNWRPGNQEWVPFSGSGSGNPQNPALERLRFRPNPLKGGIDPFIPKGHPRGWKYILVDEWGPYDFRRPLLWPERKPKAGAPLPGGTSAGSGKKPVENAEKPDPTRTRYEVLGPKGRWRVVSVQNAELSARSGTVPGFVDVKVKPGQVGTTKVELEYVGGPTVDHRGVRTPAGTPVRFGFSRFFAPIDWNVKFFRWSESENPNEVHANPKNFAHVLQSTPIKEVKTDRLDFAGYALVPGLPNDHYATLGEGSFSVPAGDYEIALTTDDGARVWLDGAPLITDAWKYQGPTQYTKRVHLGAGRHSLRVEHFQIDGYATLKLELKPAR